MNFKYAFLLLALSAVLLSCSDDDFGPVLQIGAAPQITSPASGSAFVLQEENADQVMTTFEWTAADFGFQAAVSYRLELDLAGNGFEDAVTLGVVNTRSLDVIVGDINNILLTKELPGETPADIEFRVVATVNDNVEPVVSDPITLTITPYTVVIVYPQLQVPGSYQGWDPANNNTVIFSRKSDGTFEGYIYFPEDATEFKYTDGPSWDVNWGDDGADGTLDRNGANIVAGPAGMYKLNVDLNEFTHTFQHTVWGLIGSATPNGWDSDQDMSYDAARDVLTITLDLVAGEIKFRANDAWDLNFGDNGGNGSLEYDGENILIPEDGNYTIDLILNQPRYTYTITKN